MSVDALINLVNAQRRREMRQKDMDGKPMPPCGDKETHYHWTEKTPFTPGCPLCARRQMDERKRAEEDDYINRLAKAIARELAELEKTS